MPYHLDTQPGPNDDPKRVPNPNPEKPDLDVTQEPDIVNDPKARQ